MIPPNAKKVFSGKIFDVYQWEQKMFDGSTAIFESVKRPNTVDIIAIVGDKILYLEQEQPHEAVSFACLPGGRVDDKEEALAAAKRELAEETGYVSNQWELFHTSHKAGKVDFTINTFLVKNAQHRQDQNLDPGERIKVKFITFEEFLDLADADNFQHASLRPLLIKAKYNKQTGAELRKRLFGTGKN